MNRPCAILLLSIFAGLTASVARADSMRPMTVTVSKVSDNDLAVITEATHYSQLSVVDVTVHDQSIAFAIFSEAYKGGKATRFSYQPEPQRWYPAEKNVTAKVCLSLEMNEPPAPG